MLDKMQVLYEFRAVVNTLTADHYPPWKCGGGGWNKTATLVLAGLHKASLSKEMKIEVNTYLAKRLVEYLITLFTPGTIVWRLVRKVIQETAAQYTEHWSKGGTVVRLKPSYQGVSLNGRELSGAWSYYGRYGTAKRDLENLHKVFVTGTIVVIGENKYDYIIVAAGNGGFYEVSESMKQGWPGTASFAVCCKVDNGKIRHHSCRAEAGGPYLNLEQGSWW